MMLTSAKKARSVLRYPPRNQMQFRRSVSTRSLGGSGNAVTMIVRAKMRILLMRRRVPLHCSNGSNGLNVDKNGAECRRDPAAGALKMPRR
jgi:hypothetical protein